jgi:hypothetical protein
MATLTQPTPEQLHDARLALLRVVLPYRYTDEAPPLWRACHAALCQVEAALDIAYTLPPRDERRVKRGVDAGS